MIFRDCVRSAVGACLFIAAPAVAQPSEADLRCLVVGFALASSDQEEHRNAAVPFSVYYLGRIDGQGEVADLETRLGDLAAEMSADDIKTEAARCGAAFQRRAADLQAAGKALQERAQAAE